MGPTKLNLHAIVPVDRVEKSHFLPGVFNTHESISKPTPKPIHTHAHTARPSLTNGQ